MQFGPMKQAKYEGTAWKKRLRGELGFEPRASRIYSRRPGKPEARIIPLDHTPDEWRVRLIVFIMMITHTYDSGKRATYISDSMSLDFIFVSTLNLAK